MASLLSWLNADKFPALRDKVNAIVTALNKAQTGVVGDIFRKISSSDFDSGFTSEFAYKCAAISSSYPVNGVGANYISRTFTVPAGMQWSEGSRGRATGVIAGVAQAGIYIEGVVTDYTGTTLTMMIDTIKGSGSFTAWLINDASGGDAEVIVQTTTPFAATPAIITPTVTISSENYNYTYRKRGNLLFLNFKAIFFISLGYATVTKIKIPMPQGISKDITGGAGFSCYGSASFNAPGSTTDYCHLRVSSIDDGTEGQRLVLERDENGVTINLSTGVTLTIKGSIIMPIL